MVFLQNPWKLPNHLQTVLILFLFFIPLILYPLYTPIRLLWCALTHFPNKYFPASPHFFNSLPFAHYKWSLPCPRISFCLGRFFLWRTGGRRRRGNENSGWQPGALSRVQGQAQLGNIHVNGSHPISSQHANTMCGERNLHSQLHLAVQAVSGQPNVHSFTPFPANTTLICFNKVNRFR